MGCSSVADICGSNGMDGMCNIGVCNKRPCNRNRLIGGTCHRKKGLYKAYLREYPHKIWPYMVQYLHFRILEFPLNDSTVVPGPRLLLGNISPTIIIHVWDKNTWWHYCITVTWGWYYCRVYIPWCPLDIIIIDEEYHGTLWWYQGDIMGKAYPLVN